MGCGASSESALDEKARSDPGTGGRRGDSGFWKEASVAAGTEVVDIQPWESTVRSGEGFPEPEMEDDTVRAAMRMSFGDAERTAFARRQNSAPNELARLTAYLEAGTAMASARGAPEGSPRRGQPGWRDSDTAEESVHVHALPSGGVAVHCATVAGTRGGGSGRPNQDCFAACDGLLAPTHSLVYAALFDGHGPYGHFVARHVRDRLPAWVASCSADGHAASPKPGTPAWVLRAGTVWVVDADLSLSKQSPPSLPASAPPWCASVARAFVELDGDLCSARSQLLAASKVSCEQSGCTAVAAILGDGHLLVASCGDSAAFLAVEAVPGSPLGAADVASVPRPRYGVARLTVAHKPAGEEAQRLRLAGGRVAAHPGEEHIPRVWPNPSNGSAGCGLAVARAFGDLAWKGAGVCAMPDVALRTLSPSDAFLLLCSDGVTDALSGAAAVATAADALHGGGGAANAAAAVNAAAKAAWATRFPRHARDDITCVVALLRPLSTPPTKP